MVSPAPMRIASSFGSRLTIMPRTSGCEALHEVFGRNLQKVQVDPLGEDEFHTAVTFHRMPGLALYEASRSAAIYRRSRELIEHDDVFLIAGLTPGYEVCHLGRTLNMKCGEAVILTGAEPASLRRPCPGIR